MLKFEKSMIIICAIFLFALFVTCMNRQKGVHKRVKIIHNHAFINPQEKTQQAQLVDPYSNWNEWCENIFKFECHCENSSQFKCDPVDPKTGEGQPCPPDRTGRSQMCVRPRWASRQGISFHECRPKPLGRASQKRKKKEQQVIVGHLCKRPAWADDLADWGQKNGYGNNVSKLCWRLKGGSKALKACKSGDYCDSDKLTKYMSIVAKRETTWDNETSHSLNQDQKANVAAYSKAKKRGWYDDSKHFGEYDRWSQGYGWYGHNAALTVFYWDNMAPPEILCREVESTEVHLRKMRRSFNKLSKMYADSIEEIELSNGKKAKLVGVTWYDLHRATSSGKLYREKVIPMRLFAGRAIKSGLDPFETVNRKWLGDSIPKENQNQIAEDIRQKVRMYFDEG